MQVPGRLPFAAWEKSEISAETLIFGRQIYPKNELIETVIQYIGMDDLTPSAAEDSSFGGSAWELLLNSNAMRSCCSEPLLQRRSVGNESRNANLLARPHYRSDSWLRFIVFHSSLLCLDWHSDADVALCHSKCGAEHFDWHCTSVNDALVDLVSA